ncbi:unnamed protein product [Polarella glacialis]|uniref:Uncharacterized protein n=1 Tax=Polarella glacialis TaxID=89957 RepID=A0A813D1A8_POLGL|nr:unnamed protein product [Polarella glacialis]
MIRCGWQLGLEYLDDEPPELLEDAVRMSNHCSLMNRSMARELLTGSDVQIYATSDVYAHEIVAPCHRHFTMFPPISYDLSFALKVPSLIRPKGIRQDDPRHMQQVGKALRIEPDKIQVWIQSLVWVRQPPIGASALRSSLQLSQASAAVEAGWEALLTCPDRGMPRDGECLFSRVVVDTKPPPSWLYAAYRFYVGDVAHRPRDYRPVDLEWLASANLLAPD